MDFLKRFYFYFLTCPHDHGPWVTDAKIQITKRVLTSQQQGWLSDETINLVEPPNTSISTQSPQHVCDEGSPQSKKLRSDVNASSTAAVNPVEHQNCSVGNPLATSSSKSSPIAEDEDSDGTSLDACIAARKRRIHKAATSAALS